LPAAYKADFIDLQSQVINSLMGAGGAIYNRFLQGAFPFISPGDYRIKLQYVLPGNIKGTSETFNFNNFVQ
jgi:hypothetical protein